MQDKLFAALGLGTLIAFVGVIIAKVPDTPLVVVVVLVVAMAVYDFWGELFGGR